ncbi:MAG: cytochrome c oxidase assembly protein [Parashewanella sp.]
MTTPKSNKKLIMWLAFGCIGMFGFGFALVPLYNVMCKQLGINGKTSNTAAAYDQQQVVDKNRTVTIEFVSQTEPGMPWEFGPTINQIKVHPGELVKTKFYASNNSPNRIVAQAIPSISPGQGAVYFHKTECFCFTQQPLDGNTNVDYPLVFFVDPQLPKDIHTLTLSYTLYDITNRTLVDVVKEAQAQGVIK